MRKRLACGIVLAVISLALSGCMPGEQGKAAAIREEEVTEGSRLQEEYSEDVQQEEETEQTAVRIKTPIRDLDEAYEVILNYCTGEFIGYYPIDETFLGWLYASYGEEAVERLAG